MEIIIILVLFVVAVIMLRLLGAWMLRINDIIDINEQILDELKKINNAD